VTRYFAAGAEWVGLPSLLVVSMRFDLRTIKGQRDRLRRTFPGSALNRDGDEQYRVVGSVLLDFDVRKDDLKFLFVGQLAATLEVDCSRCLELFCWFVNLDVDLSYLPASENVGGTEARVEESDLGTAFYQDEHIDLEQLMHEQFQLALPMKPLCYESCRGLCGVCGCNRNTTKCQCVEQWQDPRLAVLKTLLH